MAMLFAKGEDMPVEFWKSENLEHFCL